MGTHTGVVPIFVTATSRATLQGAGLELSAKPKSLTFRDNGM
jgi:hypothetical protein